MGGEQIVKCALTWHFGRRGRRGLGDSGIDLGKFLEGQSRFSRTYSIFKYAVHLFTSRVLEPFFNLSRFNSPHAIMLTWLWLRSLEDIDSKAKSFWSDIRACGVVCQRTSHYHRLAPRKTRQRLFAPPKTCQRHSGQRGYDRIWVTAKDKIRILKRRKLIVCQWEMINCKKMKY